MRRAIPPGRGRGAPARGRASFTALAIDEIFQDPSSDEDVDVTIEETGFVVASPSARPVKLGAGSGNKPTDPISSDPIGTAPVVAAAGSTQSEQSEGQTSQKLGDMVEEEQGRSPVAGAKEHQIPQTDLETQQKGKKSWAAVVGNRENGMNLNFVPPSEEGIVEFSQEDIDAGVSAWSTAIVGQIMGESPRFKEILGFVHRVWSRIEIPRIHQLQSGVFLFNFKSEESKRKVMARNWRFKQEMILFSDWTPDYKPATARPTTRAIWIRLPDLNFQFWTKQGIEKIVSGVGRPISTDALTANRDALKYARALVDINLLKPYPSEVKCKLPDGTPYTQKIIYEDLPEPPKWDFGEKNGEGTKEKEVEAPSTTVLSETDSEANHAPEDEALEQNMPGTNQKKKRKRKKKLPPASVQERDATVGQENATSTATEVEVTVGQENATSTATEVQEKGIPNAAGPVNKEGVPDPNKMKRNRKPNVRIWT